MPPDPEAGTAAEGMDHTQSSTDCAHRLPGRGSQAVPLLPHRGAPKKPLLSSAGVRSQLQQVGMVGTAQHP